MLFFLTACTINRDEHIALIEQLRNEDSAGYSDETEEAESTHYINYDAEDSCLTFESSNLPSVAGNSWGFSLRMVTIPETGKYLSMLQTPKQKIFLRHSDNYTNLYICSELLYLDSDENIQEICNEYSLTNEELELEEGDRITISYDRNTSQVYFFQNMELKKSFDTIHLIFEDYQHMTFGCTPISKRFPWRGGIDALIIFSNAPLLSDVRQIIEAEEENVLEAFLSTYSITDSYWNLGEYEYPNVIDHINGRTGSVENIDFIEYYSDSE